MGRHCRLLVVLAWQLGTGAQSQLAMQSLNSSDTFSAAQISKADQAEIAELLEKNSVDWDRARVSQLRARRVALTPGDKDGLAVLSTAPVDCGVTGNCFFAVLQLKDKGWRVVLRDTSVDGFAITRRTHHGLYDLELSSNDSADTSRLYVMAFDGTLYHFSHCSKVNGTGGAKRTSSAPCPDEGTE